MDGAEKIDADYTGEALSAQESPAEEAILALAALNNCSAKEIADTGLSRWHLLRLLDFAEGDYIYTEVDSKKQANKARQAAVLREYHERSPMDDNDYVELHKRHGYRLVKSREMYIRTLPAQIGESIRPAKCDETTLALAALADRPVEEIAEAKLDSRHLFAIVSYVEDDYIYEHGNQRNQQLRARRIAALKAYHKHHPANALEYRDLMKRYGYPKPPARAEWIQALPEQIGELFKPVSNYQVTSALRYMTGLPHQEIDRLGLGAYHLHSIFNFVAGKYLEQGNRHVREKRLPILYEYYERAPITEDEYRHMFLKRGYTKIPPEHTFTKDMLSQLKEHLVLLPDQQMAVSAIKLLVKHLRLNESDSSALLELVVSNSYKSKPKESIARSITNLEASLKRRLPSLHRAALWARLGLKGRNEPRHEAAVESAEKKGRFDITQRLAAHGLHILTEWLSERESEKSASRHNTNSLGQSDEAIRIHTERIFKDLADTLRLYPEQQQALSTHFTESQKFDLEMTPELRKALKIFNDTVRQLIKDREVFANAQQMALLHFSTGLADGYPRSVCQTGLKYEGQYNVYLPPEKVTYLLMSAIDRFIRIAGQQQKKLPNDT